MMFEMTAEFPNIVHRTSMAHLKAYFTGQFDFAPTWYSDIQHIQLVSKSVGAVS